MVSFMYRRIRRTASKCSFLGYCINRLIMPTAYEMSGLERVRKIRHPTICLYIVASSNSLPSVEHSRVCTSTGINMGLHSSIPNLSIRSLAYLCCHMNNPPFVYSTSRPRKCFSSPKVSFEIALINWP